MSYFKLFTGDNIKVMRKQFSDNIFDSCVTDGPYGIRFMGKAWDSFDISKRHNKRNESAKKRKSEAGKKNKRVW